jgi:hypothetical protein
MPLPAKSNPSSSAAADRRADITLVCGSVFRAEVDVLRCAHWPHLPLRYRASALAALVAEERGRGHRVVLVSGASEPALTALAAQPGVVRTRASCDGELLLGRAEYQRLVRADAFLLFPAWAHGWERIFTEQLGLNRTNAVDRMRDRYRRLVYLDTGLALVSPTALQACSDYCGLRSEVRTVPLEPLRAAIQEALDRLAGTGRAPTPGGPHNS